MKDNVKGLMNKLPSPKTLTSPRLLLDRMSSPRNAKNRSKNTSSPADHHENSGLHKHMRQSAERGFAVSLQAPAVSLPSDDEGFSETASLTSPARTPRSMPNTPRNPEEEIPQGWFGDMLDSLIFNCCSCSAKSAAFAAQHEITLTPARKDDDVNASLNYAAGAHRVREQIEF